MFEESWKNWILAAILIGGVGMEVLKHLPQDESVSWKNENMHISDDTPYSVRTDDAKKVVPPPMVVAPKKDLQVLKTEAQTFTANNQIQATDSNKLKVPLSAAKKEGEEYEEVIDPVTGKKVLVKKKKKKKKDDKKDVAALTTPSLPNPSQLAGLLDPNADLGAAVAAAAAAPAGSSLPDPTEATNQAGGSTNSIPTLQDWERLLLSSPNRAETLLFIKDYQANIVSTNNFYVIVRAMLADSRSDMKQLGLLCAGTVMSATSFTLLADIDKNDTTGTLKPTADTYLQKYSVVAQLSTLRTVLTGSDTHASAMAAQNVDTIAKSSLGNTTTGSDGTATASSASSQFSAFLTILKSLETSSDSTLAQAATQAYNDIYGDLQAAGINTQVQAASAQEPWTNQ